jgi:polyhydroxyalkanoate synthesis regulator phasin
MESIRKLANLGFGLLDITEEKARLLADELIKRGEVRSEKSGQLVKEIMARGDEVRKTLQMHVEAGVEKALSKAGLAKATDIEKLVQRVEELEKKLGAAE